MYNSYYKLTAGKKILYKNIIYNIKILYKNII